MINAGMTQVSTPSDREVQVTRLFNAPREHVFDAFTKPELLRRWYTGGGAVLETCDVDLRPAGRYRYVWKMAQGEMGMSGEFLEIEPPARFVATLDHDQPWYPGSAVTTALFTESGGKTTLQLTVRFESKEARDAVLATPWAQKYGEGFDALDALFAAMSA